MSSGSSLVIPTKYFVIEKLFGSSPWLNLRLEMEFVYGSLSRPPDKAIVWHECNELQENCYEVHSSSGQISFTDLISIWNQALLYLPRECLSGFGGCWFDCCCCWLASLCYVKFKAYLRRTNMIFHYLDVVDQLVLWFIVFLPHLKRETSLSSCLLVHDESFVTTFWFSQVNEIPHGFILLRMCYVHVLLLVSYHARAFMRKYILQLHDVLVLMVYAGTDQQNHVMFLLSRGLSSGMVYDDDDTWLLWLSLELYINALMVLLSFGSKLATC